MGNPPLDGAARPGGAARAAFVALVTVVAALLVARTHIRSLQWRAEQPLMSLSDPARALFVEAEGARREVQSGALPRWLAGPGPCAFCSEQAVDSRWDELRAAYRSYRASGYHRHGAKWLRTVEAARLVSLAGWGNPKRLEDLRAANASTFPEYLEERRDELLSRGSSLEAARVSRIGRLGAGLADLRFGLAFLSLCALGAWKVGWIRFPALSARLAAPTLGRGLLVFVWAEGFVSVCTRLRWDDPDGPFSVFRMVPGLSLAIGVTCLFRGTRRRPSERPLRRLFRCPTVARSRRALYIAGVASAGLCFALSSITWHVSQRLGLPSSWTDGLREAFTEGTSSDALWQVFGMTVVVPFAEELAYRGALFGGLVRRMSPHRAALVSSLLFAASHGYGWRGFCFVAFSGYLWARLAARTGSLVPGLVGHATVNAFAAAAQFLLRA